MTRLNTVILGGALICVSAGCGDPTPDQTTHHPVLPDVSGLVWVEGDEFIAIHDAKDEPSARPMPRASLLRIPEEKYRGVPWRRLSAVFPDKPGWIADDIESGCRLPDGRGFLFCESGQEGKTDHHMYHTELDRPNDRLVVIDFLKWPVPVTNVEATEVAKVGDQLLFLYAERADGSQTTMLRYAPLSLAPLSLGEFQEVAFRSPDPTGPRVRPMVGLTVTSDGWLYAVSSLDSGRDDGGYRSVIWKIGRIHHDGDGPTVALIEPQRAATFDGGKIESVAIRVNEGKDELWFGTDDEDFGGILRPVAGQPR